LFLTPAGLDEAGEGPGTDPALEMITAGGRLKIGDFGLACRLESEDERKTTICGRAVDSELTPLVTQDFAAKPHKLCEKPRALNPGPLSSIVRCLRNWRANIP
jgi:hypothetical protein